MGRCVKIVDKKKIKAYFQTAGGTAVACAFVLGMFTHMYALTNNLHNYDDIAIQPAGYGTGIVLGRWLLTMLGDAADMAGVGYNLPFVNGVLFILLLSICAGLLVSLFEIENRVCAGLVGALFVTFPTAASTMFFRYTAVYYGLGILLAVLAAWVLRRYKYGLLLSALCTALSMGIYQAYAPLTIGIFVLMLIRQALKEDADAKKLVLGGLYDCAALGLGAALYFLLLKAAQAAYGTGLLEYQGVASMGNLSLAQLPGLIVRAFTSYCALPFRDCYGIAPRKIIRLLYLLLWLATAVLIVYLLVKKVKKPLVRVFFCLIWLIFPVAVNFIVIMCPDGWIYTIMAYSFSLVLCAPVVLLEGLLQGTAKSWSGILAKAAGLLVAVIVLYNAYYTNINYTAMYFANRQVENYLNSIVVQIRVTEGFDADKQWALLGEIEDPLLESPWEDMANYGGNYFTGRLLNQYSRNNWIQSYFGYRVPAVSEEKAAQLWQTEEVKVMPCWPSEGSIRVIGDTVVVKFQEAPQE